MLIGITGHKGVLAKSLVKYLNKKNYKLSLYQHDILDYKKLSNWLKISLYITILPIKPIIRSIYIKSTIYHKYIIIHHNTS